MYNIDIANESDKFLIYQRYNPFQLEKNFSENLRMGFTISEYGVLVITYTFICQSGRLLFSEIPEVHHNFLVPRSLV